MPRGPGNSVISSYFELVDKPTSKDVYDKGLRNLEGQVTKTYFVDDPQNRSKQYVEYDVLARDAKGGMVTYKNCRYAGDMYSTSDFSETILQDSDFAFKGKLEKANLPENLSGTRVIIGFLDGSLDKPIIIGGAPHKRKKGSTKADGVRKRGEFRGLSWEISKKGELNLTYQGNRKPDGSLERPDSGPTSIKIDESGNLEIDQSKNGTPINNLKFDRNSGKISINSDSNLEIDVDGSKIELDGGSVKISTGSTEITLDSSGQIELKGQMVDIGEAASALAALGPQLMSWLTSHTHIVPVLSGSSAGAYPSQPPTVPPPTSILSTSVKLKD